MKYFELLLVQHTFGGYSHQTSCKDQGPASKDRGFVLVQQIVRLFVITLSNPL